MIPFKARQILGSRDVTKGINTDGDYGLDGAALADLNALCLRLYTEQRMDADEMRDWANRLHLMVSGAVELDPPAGPGEPKPGA